MPTTLPIKVSALPFASRRTSILSGVSYEFVIVAIWSLAMLAMSLWAIHRGLPTEIFNSAFQ